ncbi:MAG: hypothetical protein AMJ79_16085 [Phycisphaerae bacterium SM23_30]|nr:MAG: hypothetical protein AMJ79_16085 [Phycisphaerae bacterium SM23_30]
MQIRGVGEDIFDIFRQFGQVIFGRFKLSDGDLSADLTKKGSDSTGDIHGSGTNQREGRGRFEFVGAVDDE